LFKKSLASLLALLLIFELFPHAIFADPNANKTILAQNESALFKVFIETGSDSIVQHAADELVNYLGQVTSATFQLETGAAPSATPTIVVGRNAYTENLVPELTGTALGEDGFVIRKIQQNIIIAGSHSRGTMYGVNYFLDHYVGVKWFAPEYTKIPSKPLLEVEVDDDIQIPRFEYREMYVSDGNNEQYRAHNLLNGKFVGRYNHVPQSAPGLNSWSKFWPDDIHNFFTIVPQTEYHNGRQLLAMNEDVRQIAANKLITKINQQINDGKDASWGFSQEDDIWYPDSASQAFADQHGGSLAAPTLDLVNDVARRVNTAIPGARIGTLAYMFSLDAPTNMTAEDNVVITIAPIFKNHGYAINSPQNQSYKDNIDKWAQISDNLMVWDYLANFNGGGFLMPHPVLNAMSQTIQYLAGIPAYKGYFGQQMQNIYSPGEQGFAYLRAWVAAKLLWNPNQDYQQLIDEFVQGYYGDAAPYIKNYLNALEQSFVQSNSSLALSTPTTAPYLTFDLIRQADAWFEAAVTAVAGNPTMLDHVQKARVEVDYIALMRRIEFSNEAANQQVQWNADFENRFNRFKANTANVIDYKPGTTIEFLYEAIEVGRTTPTIPDFVQHLPASDWVDYQDNAMLLYTPVGTKSVQDPKASDNAAARVRGTTNAWAIQILDSNLPKEGKWKIYASVRIDPGNGAPGDKAFEYGIYPPNTDVSRKNISEFSDGEYHFVEFPSLYEYDPTIFDHGIWIAPPNSQAIEYLYVDRIIAVRQVPPDKSALETLLGTAEDRLTTTVEGNQPGQYPAAARTLLQAAITAAQAIFDLPDATEAQITTATSDLQTALDTYEEAKVEPSPPENNSGTSSSWYMLSDNADLKELNIVIQGKHTELVPGFNPQTRSYKLETDASEADLHIKAAHAQAKLTVTQQGKTLDLNHKISLQEGDNLLEVKVQAESGATQTYTLTIHRSKSSDIPETPIEKPDTSLIFQDLVGHWAKEVILKALAKQLINGYADQTFKPNHAATRAEFVVMLMRAQQPTAASDAPDRPVLNYTDQSSIGSWAAEAVAEASALGLVSGYEDGSFKPNLPISRAEVATIIARAIKLKQADQVTANLENGVKAPFADEKLIPGWASDAVTKLQQQGIMNGRGDNRFEPQANTTRAEAVTMLLRVFP